MGGIFSGIGDLADGGKRSPALDVAVRAGGYIKVFVFGVLLG